jgi:hypothetical protein
VWRCRGPDARVEFTIAALARGRNVRQSVLARGQRLSDVDGWEAVRAVSELAAPRQWFGITKSNNTTEEKVEILASRVPEDVKKAASWAQIPFAERRKNHNNNFLG